MILRGQTAVLTGASSGIGRAIALGLAEHDAKLCLIGRKLEALEDLARSLKDRTSEASCYRADLTVDQDISALLSSLQRECPQVNLLVHCAGAISMGRFESAGVDELDWLYRLNVRAPYALTQALLPALKLGCGQVVFVNSSAGVNANPALSQYSATKFALRAIADSLRQELNAEGVRVLSVYPGRTASPMQESVHRMEGKNYHSEDLLQPGDVASIVIHAVSLPRSAEVTDIFIRPMKRT